MAESAEKQNCVWGWEQGKTCFCSEFVDVVPPPKERIVSEAAQSEYIPKILFTFSRRLLPDFAGNANSIDLMAMSGLDVYAHNLETVERLTPWVRDPRAKYGQSLKGLARVKETNPSVVTKTSIMLGLGESDEEITKSLADLRGHGVDVVTFGQYMQPTKRHLLVKEWVTPEKFDYWAEVAKEMGFLYVASGPLVRSSYKAGEYFLKNVLKNRRENNRISSAGCFSPHWDVLSGVSRSFWFEADNSTKFCR